MMQKIPSFVGVREDSGAGTAESNTDGTYYKTRNKIRAATNSTGTCTSQCRDIHNKIGLILPVCVSQGIRKDKTSLRICVVDLDCFAIHCFDDIARLRGCPRRHVLAQRNET